MNLTEQQKKGQEVFFRIIAEAWENDEFKELLLTNPEETLEKFFGRKLPIDKKIKVTDQSDPDYLYINIPIKPQNFETRKKKQDRAASQKVSNEGITDYESLYDSLQKKYAK